jgi:hypothetical protein
MAETVYGTSLQIHAGKQWRGDALLTIAEKSVCLFGVGDVAGE